MDYNLFINLLFIDFFKYSKNNDTNIQQIFQMLDTLKWVIFKYKKNVINELDSKLSVKL